MNTKTLLALIAFMVSLLGGCAAPVPRVAGVDMPASIKTEAYYKSNLKDVVSKAEAGDASSQLELAFIYTGYDSVGFDKKKSNFWLEKSAAQDYLMAVIGLAGRHYDYSKWGYTKDIPLADKMVSHAYDIYLTKPHSSWTQFEIDTLAAILSKRSEFHLSDKDFAQNDLCTALRLGVKNTKFIKVINDDLRAIGRTCN